MVISFGPTGGSGKASFTDLNIRKALDKASPILMLNCAKGTPVRSAVLTCRAGPDRQIVYKITMSDVYISKVVLHADSLADRPTESVSLTYARIQWEYTPTLADGRPGTPVETGWDVKANVQQ
jgi:type VI secretion system secreted protein Hcp